MVIALSVMILCFVGVCSFVRSGVKYYMKVARRV